MTKDNTIYTARVRVKPEVAFKIKVEAVKNKEAMGDYIEKIYKFFKQNSK